MYENRKQEFLDLFYREIFPYLAQGERKRKQYIFIIISIIILSIAGCVALLYFLIKDSQFDAELVKSILSIVIFFMFTGVIPALLLKIKFIQYIKERYMNGIVSYFNGMKWINSDAIDKDSKIQTFKQNPLLYDENITELWIDDYFTGEYNHTTYSIYEANVRNVRGSGKGRHDMRIFKGITLELDLKNLISDEILIYSKDMKLNKDGEMYMPIIYLIGLIVFIFIGATHYQSLDIAGMIMFGIVITAYAFICIYLSFRIKKFLNKNKFNKSNDLNINDRFCINTKNIQETEKLIKPDLFAVLQNISLTFKSKGIALNTYREYGNTKAMVIIPTNLNAFEIGSLFKPLDKPQGMSKFFDQLSCIMDLIDYFADLENKSRD